MGKGRRSKEYSDKDLQYIKKNYDKSSVANITSTINRLRKKDAKRKGVEAIKGYPISAATVRKIISNLKEENSTALSSVVKEKTSKGIRSKEHRQEDLLHLSKYYTAYQVSTLTRQINKKREKEARDAGISFIKGYPISQETVRKNIAEVRMSYAQSLTLEEQHLNIGDKIKAYTELIESKHISRHKAASRLNDLYKLRQKQLEGIEKGGTIVDYTIDRILEKVNSLDCSKSKPRITLKLEADSPFQTLIGIEKIINDVNKLILEYEKNIESLHKSISRMQGLLTPAIMAEMFFESEEEDKGDAIIYKETHVVIPPIDEDRFQSYQDVEIVED